MAARSVMREALQMLRPPPRDRHGALTPLLVGLTFVTGLVDALSYLRLGHVFVANMTGNVVFLGFALAGAAGLSAGASLAALAAFMLGALLGGALGARYAANRGHVLRAASAVQAALVCLALVVSIAASTPLGDGVRYALIAMLAIAMGVQNAAAQRLAVPELTTTVLTRTLTGMASEAAMVGGPGGRAGRRGVAVTAMLAGAFAGALLVIEVSLAAPLIAAAVIVIAIGLVVHRASSGSAAWL